MGVTAGVKSFPVEIISMPNITGFLTNPFMLCSAAAIKLKRLEDKEQSAQSMKSEREAATVRLR